MRTRMWPGKKEEKRTKEKDERIGGEGEGRLRDNEGRRGKER